MGLFKSRNVLRISPTDWQDNYICNKIAPGENVEIDLEDGPWGQRLVITANRTSAKKVRFLNESGVVNANENLVVVDASVNHVVVTLPPAKDYVGQLSIVCADPSNGIELVPNESTSNVIFDLSNASFNAKGDALILVSDRGMSPQAAGKPHHHDHHHDDEELVPEEVPFPGTWYVVGRYAANWYA